MLAGLALVVRPAVLRPGFAGEALSISMLLTSSSSSLPFSSAVSAPSLSLFSFLAVSWSLACSADLVLNLVACECGAAFVSIFGFLDFVDGADDAGDGVPAAGFPLCADPSLALPPPLFFFFPRPPSS